MSFRFALGKYIKPNNSQFKDQIVYQDDDFVVIRDQFPKALVHWLLLPKDPKITLKNPLTDAFESEEIRNKVTDLIPLIKEKMMEEIDKLGYEAIDDQFEESIKIGVHSVPSMANVHVHFITSDLTSERMKRKHHYNSFSTEFFVNFEELPLSPNDHRLDSEKMEKGCNKNDLICFHCKKNFDNRFAELKRHSKTELSKIYKEKQRAKKPIEIIEID